MSGRLCLKVLKAFFLVVYCGDKAFFERWSAAAHSFGGRGDFPDISRDFAANPTRSLALVRIILTAQLFLEIIRSQHHLFVDFAMLLEFTRRSRFNFCTQPHELFHALR
jgi:hypothetical protein